jgi:hypothetical protein
MSTRCRCLSTRTVTNVTCARETETTIKASSYLVTNFRFARASDTGDNSPRAPADPAPPPQVRRPGIQSRKSGHVCHVCHICHPTNENIICRSTPSLPPIWRSTSSASTKLARAPGAPHLGELAATSKAIPAPLLVDLTAKLAQLDPRVVGWVKRSAAWECARSRRGPSPTAGGDGSARARPIARFNNYQGPTSVF